MSIEEFIPFSPPTIGEDEIREVVDTLHSTWVTTGPKTRRFEDNFMAFVQAPGALALNSCTAALHTALVALGVGPGDEVITTPMTFTATVNVIEQVGARPVLADIEMDTLNIDPRHVARLITPRTRAILPVHYAGHPADLDALHTLAQEHQLHVIEDAAHALPAKYRGRSIGSGRNPVAFSFYATKNLTTIEGGMLTGDPQLLEHARVISLHGMTRDAWRRYDKGGNWYYEVTLPGFKYNMTDVQAAIGLHQLARLQTFQQRRQQIVEAYSRAFEGVDALMVPIARADVEHAWHLYVLRLREGYLDIDRNRFIDELTARNIGTSVHFIPIHLHPYYRDKYGYRAEDFPVAYGQFTRMLSLPLNPLLTDAQVGRVIEAVLDVIKHYRLLRVAA